MEELQRQQGVVGSVGLGETPKSLGIDATVAELERPHGHKTDSLN